jgi:hypothetical protein
MLSEPSLHFDGFSNKLCPRTKSAMKEDCYSELSLVILDGGFSNKLTPPRTKIADERRRANASASPVLIFNGLLNQRRR